MARRHGRPALRGAQAVRHHRACRAARQRPPVHAASGVAEVAAGALLIAPKTRKVGALASIALFLGVFPANVNMVRLWSQEPAKPVWMRIGAWARLPLQIPMIAQAYKIYRSA